MLARRSDGELVPYCPKCLFPYDTHHRETENDRDSEWTNRCRRKGSPADLAGLPFAGVYGSELLEHFRLELGGDFQEFYGFFFCAVQGFHE